MAEEEAAGGGRAGRTPRSRETSETLAAWQPLPAETKSARWKRGGGAVPLAVSVEYGVADAVGTWVVGLSSCLKR